LNWAIAISAFGVVGHLIIAVWYYGRLTQKVEDHGERLDKTEVQILDHETRISRLEGKQ
jgi:hypothetical protein